MAQIKLSLKFYGDPVLRRRSKPVEIIAGAEKDLLSQMQEIMRLGGGIGLAAPQVGVNKQLVLIDIGQGPVAIFNPRITKKQGVEKMEEGCLSLPGIYVKVRRAKSIQVVGLNEQNERVEISACDLLARALQHEIDHLRGRLIIDYAGILQRVRLRKKLKDYLKAVSG